MKILRVKTCDNSDTLVVKEQFAPGITIFVYKIKGKDLYRFEVVGPQLHYFERQTFYSKNGALDAGRIYAKKVAKKYKR